MSADPYLSSIDYTNVECFKCDIHLFQNAWHKNYFDAQWKV